MVTREDHLRAVRRQLDEMRRRLGIQNGDELDHTLIAVEALAGSIHALSSDAAALIAEGERNVGMIVSAAMTRQVLWRMCGVPATVGALAASLVLATGLTMQGHADGVQRELDRAAQVEAWNEQRATTEAERQALVQERTNLAAEKSRIEATLPALIANRANALGGAAKALALQEAAYPGLIDWTMQHGRDTMRLMQANHGSLCPKVTWDGPVMVCMYPKT